MLIALESDSVPLYLPDCQCQQPITYISLRSLSFIFCFVVAISPIYLVTLKTNKGINLKFELPVILISNRNLFLHV